MLIQKMIVFDEIIWAKSYAKGFRNVVCVGNPFDQGLEAINYAIICNTLSIQINIGILL